MASSTINKFPSFAIRDYSTSINIGSGDTQWEIDKTSSSGFPVAYSINYGFSGAVNLNVEAVTMENGHIRLLGYGRSLTGSNYTVTVHAVVLWLKM